MKTQKLPKVFKEKWVAALRSGKYKQSKSLLYDREEDGFCCLGVAANICGVGKNNLKQAFIETTAAIAADKTKKLPKILYGDTYNPIVAKLAAYNDDGKSFKWIASYIERYL